MPDLAHLPNLGPASSKMLRAAGIADLAQLRALGAVRAFALVRRSQPQASLNLLWALESALTGIPWQEVARWQRERLLAELAAAGHKA